MCAFRRLLQAGAKDTAAEFGSGFNTKAVCPADLASEVWQTRWEPFYSTLIKKEIEIFLIFMEIQMGSVAKSFVRKGILLYEELR
jgi:hypothetical protein